MNEVNKMSTWFECKVKYDKMMENGMQKKVTEPYMVDALSFTEAEARIIKEMTPFISGDFSVANIKRANISELFFDETGDKWFKCKSQFYYARRKERCGEADSELYARAGTGLAESFGKPVGRDERYYGRLRNSCY